MPFQLDEGEWAMLKAMDATEEAPPQADAIEDSDIDALQFYREQLRVEVDRNDRLKELDRLLLNLFNGYGYEFRDALDGVRLLLEKAKADRGW